MKIARALWVTALICGCLVLGLGVITVPQYWAAQTRVSQQRVQELDQGLAKYLLDHRRCPEAAADLVARGYVSRGALKDAWGNRIAVSCSAAGAHAQSAGRDKIFDTRDDIASVQ
jgi:hypothetical protein